MTTITDRNFKIISLEHSWPMVASIMSTDDACYAVGIDPPHYPVPAIVYNVHWYAGECLEIVPVQYPGTGPDDFALWFNTPPHQDH